MGTAIAYLRKSRVYADRPGAVSHAQQEDAVRALAQRHGYNLRPDQIVEDWGRSGGAGKEHRRPSYLALRAAVVAGSVTDVFAYDQSRLTRSTMEWAALAAACRDNAVSIHLVNGGTKDFASADGRMTANILADIAAGERERAQERALDAITRRRAKGEQLGPPAYGVTVTLRDGTVVGEGDDPAAVVDAFRVAGSYNGAAKLLNLRGIPPKRGTYWRSAAVKRVIAREAPSLMPLHPRSGARTSQQWLLAGLLVCPCGGVLTPTRRPNRPVPIYRCQRAWTDVTHPRPASVSENSVLPWVKHEAARLSIPHEVRRQALATETERQALAARKSRIAQAFIDGNVPAESYEQQTAEVDKQLSALDTRGRVVQVPSIEWDGDPRQVNAILRAIFVRINLGADMRPTNADWSDPSLRAA